MVYLGDWGGEKIFLFVSWIGCNGMQTRRYAVALSTWDMEENAVSRELLQTRWGSSILVAWNFFEKGC